MLLYPYISPTKFLKIVLDLYLHGLKVFASRLCTEHLETTERIGSSDTSYGNPDNIRNTHLTTLTLYTRIDVMQASPFKDREEVKQLEKELIAKAKISTDERFSIFGLELFIPKTVFNTVIFSCATDRMITHIPIKPGKSFLDLGCGCGLYAILAAKSGCYPVYATDINQDAIHATEINAKANTVSVTTIKSDIFHDVPKKHKFGII